MDDQPEMRKSVIRILRLAGYTCLEAADGSAALATLQKEPVQLVLSDLRMPGMDGIELLHHVRKLGPIPFVLMTGFAEIIQSAEAYEIGVDGFLLKPFGQDELLEALRDAEELRRTRQAKADGATTDGLSDNFCGIPVREFVAGREIRFPIYLKLSDAKFVRIAHGGEDLAPDKIQELEKRGVAFLYLRRPDFKVYVSFTARMAEVALANRQVPAHRKAELLQRSSQVILELGFHQHLDRAAVDLARTNVEQSLSLLADSPELFPLLETLTAHRSALFSHSMAVAMLACLTAKSLGWESSPLFFRVVAGALFHDLGKRDFPEALLTKDPVTFTEEERALWRSHPRLGSEMLSTVPDLPDEIAQIVLHHHERADGSGYPQGLASARIHPVAKLLGLADEFAKIYAGAPGYGPARPPLDALAELTRQSRRDEGQLPLWEHLEALRAAITGGKKSGA